jgi:hypothetical protein
MEHPIPDYFASPDSPTTSFSRIMPYLDPLDAFAQDLLD